MGQKLQWVRSELGRDLEAGTVLAIEELDDPASTLLGHTLRLVISSYNMLSKKRRKEALFKSLETLVS